MQHFHSIILEDLKKLNWNSIASTSFDSSTVIILKDDAVKVLHSIWQQIWPHDWKRSVFIPIPNKGNAKECSNYRTIVLFSQASKVMIKILQATFQQNTNHELPDVQAGLKKAEEPEIKLLTSVGSSKKAGEFQKNIYFCFIDYAKVFDCVDHNKHWKILQEMGIPDYLTTSWEISM